MTCNVVPLYTILIKGQKFLEPSTGEISLIHLQLLPRRLRLLTTVQWLRVMQDSLDGGSAHPVTYRRTT
jgi:hypothetical protein